MKGLFTLTIILLQLGLLKAQINTPSSCIPPQALLSNYDRDVKQLALQRIYQQNSPYKDSIIVPAIYVDSIWNAFATVYNVTSNTDRDSVFDKYCIHIYQYTYACPMITLDFTTYPDSIPGLDTLLTALGYSFYSVYASGLYYVSFITDRSLNAQALCNHITALYNIPAQPDNGNVGSGDKIIYEISGDSAILNFVIGFGDCPSGCTSTRSFSFAVFNDCSVADLGIINNIALGDQLPPLANCNISSGISPIILSNSITLSPTPTTHQLYFKTENIQPQTLTVYDVNGSMIFTLPFKPEIDVTQLSSGVYFVEVKSNEGIARKRFVKM